MSGGLFHGARNLAIPVKLNRVEVSRIDIALQFFQLMRRSRRRSSDETRLRARWRGLALFAVDGTTLRVPDSDENREHFCLASGGERGDSGYPMVRMAALMALRYHLVAEASFGPFSHGEYHYANDLWAQLPDRRKGSK